MDTEQLLDYFRGLIALYKLDVRVNPKPNEIPREIKSPLALDVEHDESGNFVGVGFTSDGHTIYYFNDLYLFRNIDFSAVSLICHNGRTDFDCLRNWGIDVKDIQLIHDTELFSHILDSSRHGYGLKTISSQDIGINYPSYDDIVGKRTFKQIKERKTLDKQPLELVSLYNAMDVFATWKLYEKQAKASSAGNQLTASASRYFEQLERPLAFILQNMENRGICVDLNYLRMLKDMLMNQKRPIEKEIQNELGDINLNSPKQLLGALHAKEIFPTFKGKPSTDKRALAQMAESSIVFNLQKYSEIENLLSSFVVPYLERNQGIIHPWFNQCGTRTGRLSCSNPNLLQIPKRTENGRLVRRMFIPRPGMVMGDCDYGQIEPRVLAHLSKDPVLCKMFNDGVDFHDYTAQRLGISRDRAKVLNLSVGYRATKYSVQRQLGGTLEEAHQEIDKWWNLFPALRRWQDNLIYNAKSSGFCETLLGRRIKVDGLTESNLWRRESAERQIINNITQGSAAEIMKLAMIKIHKIASQLGLLVQVYDELLFEAPEQEIDDAACWVKQYMEEAIKLNVPLTVDMKIGPNWADCK